jgi:hypothetical protein
MRKEVSIETTIPHPLAFYYPAGIERLRCNQKPSVSNVQPYYSKENVQMNKKIVLSVLVVLATLTLAACAPSASSLSPEKGEAYASKVDDIVENLIIGVSENDYAKYTRDMDQGFLKNYESSLHEVAEEISRKFGAYLSKTLDHVEGQGLRRIVVYRLVFENEPDVLLKVTFNIYDSKHIIGTYWNSE